MTATTTATGATTPAPRRAVILNVSGQSARDRHSDSIPFHAPLDIYSTSSSSSISSTTKLPPSSLHLRPNPPTYNEDEYSAPSHSRTPHCSSSSSLSPSPGSTAVPTIPSSQLLTSSHALILVGGFGTRLRPLTVSKAAPLAVAVACTTLTPAALMAQASRRVLQQGESPLISVLDECSLIMAPGDDVSDWEIECIPKKLA